MARRVQSLRAASRRVKTDTILRTEEHVMSSNSSTIAVGTTRNSSTKSREAAVVFLNRLIFYNKETNVGLSIFIFIYIYF